MTSPGSEATPRIFTAVPLSDEARLHVAQLAGEAARAVEGVRWIPEANYHVTLRFIGACPVEKIEDLGSWIRKAARHLPVTLRIGGIGGFPSEGSARVIWVGAEDRVGTMRKVYNVLDKGADRCGFGRENRSYRPHVTVGRARKKPVRLTADLVEHANATPPVLMEATEIVLYRSLLSREGAEYEVIDTSGARGRP